MVVVLRVVGCGVQTITVNLQNGVTKGERWYGGGGGGIEGGWLWSPDYNSETTEGGDPRESGGTAVVVLLGEGGRVVVESRLKQ